MKSWWCRKCEQWHYISIDNPNPEDCICWHSIEEKELEK